MAAVFGSLCRSVFEGGGSSPYPPVSIRIMESCYFFCCLSGSFKESIKCYETGRLLYPEYDRRMPSTEVFRDGRFFAREVPASADKALSDS